MTKYLEKYKQIMNDYRSGKYGDKPLTMDKILKEAGEPDIFDKMEEEDIMTLIREATGMSKMAYSMALDAKRKQKG